MSFAPHHKFSGCAKIERILEELRAVGAVTLAEYENYRKYHYSLLHKLQSAKYHTETLAAYLNSQNAQQVSPQALVYRVNFHFDGFLHALGSALDILAREILNYYALLPAGNIYFNTARATINGARPGDAILPILDSPTWKSEFSDYRNTATHESIIGTSYSIKIEVVGGNASRRLVFPVPDDPRNPAAGHRRNQDIVIYCDKTLRRVLSLINQVYLHIENRAAVSGSIPL